MGKARPSPASRGIGNDGAVYSMSFRALGLARCLSLFHLVKNFAHHAAECGGAVWFLHVVGAGRGGRNVFRILRITAGKENGQTREQNREPRRHGRTTKFGHDEANFAGSDGKAKRPGGEIANTARETPLVPREGLR